ncbi:MAG: hypothetical protein HY908_17110, partial [Myxococcales bacterium]|nr:hypothetical protein [Myxococcales bacterium]
MVAGAAADAPRPLRRALAAARAAGVRSGLFVAAPLALAACVYDPRAPAAAPKTVALCLCALAGLGVALARPGRTARVRPGAPTLVWLAFAGWMALSLGWSAHGQLGHLLPWVGVGGLALGLGRLGDVRPAARLCAVVASGVCAGACLLRFAAGARGRATHGLSGKPDWRGLVRACALPLDVELPAEATTRWR